MQILYAELERKKHHTCSTDSYYENQARAYVISHGEQADVSADIIAKASQSVNAAAIQRTDFFDAADAFAKTFVFCFVLYHYIQMVTG